MMTKIGTKAASLVAVAGLVVSCSGEVGRSSPAGAAPHEVAQSASPHPSAVPSSSPYTSKAATATPAVSDADWKEGAKRMVPRTAKDINVDTNAPFKLVFDDSVEGAVVSLEQFLNTLMSEMVNHYDEREHEAEDLAEETDLLEEQLRFSFAYIDQDTLGLEKTNDLLNEYAVNLFWAGNLAPGAFVSLVKDGVTMQPDGSVLITEDKIFLTDGDDFEDFDDDGGTIRMTFDSNMQIWKITDFNLYGPIGE
ncbi:hypothetical protein [Arthrobacter sp. NPDC089319]|uniref:hypothetical protein n=1 Tax=Arthrobacter sp. NPDC089319 TaxID=3155915 RepID=UPI003428DF04